MSLSTVAYLFGGFLLGAVALGVLGALAEVYSEIRRAKEEARRFEETFRRYAHPPDHFNCRCVLHQSGESYLVRESLASYERKKEENRRLVAEIFEVPEEWVDDFVEVRLRELAE